MFDLKNHINFPTHLSGNTLDLIISRLEDSYISNIKQGELLADHHAVEFRMQADVNFKEPIIVQAIYGLTGNKLQQF